MSAYIQIAGALGVLSAFILVQLGIVRPTSYPSLILNLAGSATLAVLALLDRQWGFLLLEGSWAVVSAWSLRGRLLGRAPAPAAA
jgi:hypothetical protein